MASLRKTGGTFTVCFRFRGQQHQRSLKTAERELAETLLAEIRGRLGRMARGEKPLPNGVDPVDYIVTGNDEPAPVPPQISVPAPVPTLTEALVLFQTERKSMLASSSWVTEKIHLQNVVNCLRPLLSEGDEQGIFRDLDPDLWRQALIERAKNISPTTAAKERQTLRGFLGWAATRWKEPQLAAVELPVFKKRTRGDRFLTHDEIKAIVERGGLSENEISNLWSRLYLLPAEIAEVLKLVRERAIHEAAILLHLLIAYTGIRRGEAQRLRWMDVDLARRRISVRSRKQSRSEEESWREVDLHPVLAGALTEHRDQRASGQWVLSLDGTAPMTTDELNYHYRRPLKGSRWEKTISGGQKRVVVRPHVMRHSFASCLAMRGVDQRVIDRLVGHVTPAMARHYQHIAPTARRVAVEQLGYNEVERVGKCDNAA